MEHEPHTVGVVGLGYVGLPLAVALGATRRVVAHDIDPVLVRSLGDGVDPAGEVSAQAIRSSRVTFTTDPRLLAQAEVVIVAVPTPIDATKRPDVSALESAARTVGENLAPGALVVFESTVYPGCTEDLCLPILESASGQRVDEGFELAYSPERVVPGDAARTLEKVDKLVAGRTERALERALELYRSVVTEGTVHPVASIRVAEAAKVLENVQRDLNVALMNECALIFDRAGIDTNEVIDAAATKWNFHPYRPGLVGGHCIGVDPYYLTHMAERLDYHPDVILAGRRVNDGMGRFVARKVVELLIAADVRVRGSIVAVLGLTFKEEVADLRNSRVVELVDELARHGIELVLHDPLADPRRVEAIFGQKAVSNWSERRLDGLVLAVPHAEYLRSVPNWLADNPACGVVVDVKGVLPRSGVPGRWRL